MMLELYGRLPQRIIVDSSAEFQHVHLQKLIAEHGCSLEIRKANGHACRVTMERSVGREARGNAPGESHPPSQKPNRSWGNRFARGKEENSQRSWTKSGLPKIFQVDSEESDIVTDGNARLYLTTFVDRQTGILLGYYFSESEPEW